jgi:hypothetical protein
MTITPQAIFTTFDEAERSFDVDQWEIGGLRVWPLVRNYHAYWLCAREAFARQNEIAGSSAGLIGKLKRLSKSVLEQTIKSASDARMNDRLRKTDVLIAAHSSTRYFKVDGRWYNPYSDSICKHLEAERLDSLVLEFTGDGKFLFPRFAKSLLVQRHSYALSIAARVGARLNMPALHESLPGWDGFVRLFEDRLGQGMAPDLGSIRFRARQVLAHEQWVARILRRVRPSVAILTGYYSSDMMGFTRACRRAGVLTVEVQHGVQGKLHFAYRPWQRLPAAGYDTMPQVFWTWSAAEKENLDEWIRQAPADHAAIVGGNPCLHIYDSAGQPYALVATEASAEGRAPGELNIVFTAQAFNELPPVLMAAIRRTPHWKWWIRTHPQYMEAARSIRAQCAASRLPNIEIDGASELPLVALFDQCDVHVTEFSSSVLESHARGLRSVVINPIAKNLFQDKIDSGVAEFADTEDALVAALHGQAARRGPRAVAGAGAECFFPEVMSAIRDAVSKKRRAAAVAMDPPC